MNQLFPIIRRQRRPLLPPDDLVKEAKPEAPAKTAAQECVPAVTNQPKQADDAIPSPESESR